MTTTQAPQTRSERYPACYIRESMGDDTDDAREGQRADCRQLATRDNVDPARLIEYDDWSRSGSESARRPAQDRLMADMRAGKVDVIYARSLDRLMRSTRKLADFLDVAAGCEPKCRKDHAHRHGDPIRIVTLREGEVRQDNPSTWMFVQTIMTAAEYESRVGKVRAKAAMDTKRRNRSQIGSRPYGDLPGEDWTVVIAAVQEAGTLQGASRILNGLADCPYCGGSHDRVVSRHGHKTTPQGVHLGWEASTIGRIVRHRIKTGETKMVVPSRAKRGAWTFGTHPFQRLLVCPHDGSILTTGNRAHASTAYTCRLGRRDPNHPKPYTVAETVIMAWAVEEARRADTITLRGAIAAESEAELDALDERKRKAGIAFSMGALDQDDLAAIVEDVEAKRAEIESTRGAQQIVNLGIDWKASAAEVNARLRALWRPIKLGSDMRPISGDDSHWIVKPTELDESEVDLRGLKSDQLKAIGRRGEP